MGNTNSCSTTGAGSTMAFVPQPQSCSAPPPKPPPALVNQTVQNGQSSGSTFDTSLQRTDQMGISPLHL